jgi:hypothetical protein
MEPPRLRAHHSWLHGTHGQSFWTTAIRPFRWTRPLASMGRGLCWARGPRWTHAARRGPRWEPRGRRPCGSPLYPLPQPSPEIAAASWGRIAPVPTSASPGGDSRSGRGPVDRRGRRDRENGTSPSAPIRDAPGPPAFGGQYLVLSGRTGGRGRRRPRALSRSAGPPAESWRRGGSGIDGRERGSGHGAPPSYSRHSMQPASPLLREVGEPDEVFPAPMAEMRSGPTVRADGVVSAEPPENPRSGFPGTCKRPGPRVFWRIASPPGGLRNHLRVRHGPRWTASGGRAVLIPHGNDRNDGAPPRHTTDELPRPTAPSTCGRSNRSTSATQFPRLPPRAPQPAARESPFLGNTPCSPPRTAGCTIPWRESG